MRRITTATATLLLVSVAAALVVAGEPDPLQLLHKCRDTCARVKDYTSTLTQREFLRGKLQNTEIAFVKFRREPVSIYAKWIGESHKGREGIYVKGKNKDMIVGHEFIGPLNVTKNIKADGPEARKNSRRKISEGGLLGTARTFLRYVEMGKQNKDMRLYYGGVETFDGRPVHVIIRVLGKRKGYPAYMTMVYIDKERLLPVKSVGYDWDYRLLWLYSNVDVKTNVGLTDKDFDPKNKKYDYPRMISFKIPKLF